MYSGRSSLEGPAVDGNAQRLLVEKNGALCVHARSKLSSPALAEGLLLFLEEALDKRRSNGEEVVIQDLDVSRNEITEAYFASLLDLLARHAAHVQRFRCYGLRSLDDDAIRALAAYLGRLDRTAVPVELHLSDCAITSHGFEALLQSIKRNPGFPYRDPRSGQARPLYLRMENNYISGNVIKDWIDSPVVEVIYKVGLRRQATTTQQTRVHLLVLDDGTCPQKTGSPPQARGRLGEPLLQPAGDQTDEDAAVEDLPTALPSFAVAGTERAVVAAEAIAEALPDGAITAEGLGEATAAEAAEPLEERAEAGVLSSGEAPAQEAGLSSGEAPAQEDLPTALPSFAVAGPERAFMAAEAAAEALPDGADTVAEGLGEARAVENAEPLEERAEAGVLSSGEAPAQEAGLSPGDAPAQEDLPTALPSFAVAGPERAFAAAEAAAEAPPDGADTAAEGLGEATAAEAAGPLEERAEAGVLSSGEAPAQEAGLSPGDAPAQEDLPTALPSFAAARPDRALMAAELAAEALPDVARTAADGLGRAEAAKAAEALEERAEAGVLTSGEAPAQEAGLSAGGAPAQELPTAMPCFAAPAPQPAAEAPAAGAEAEAAEAARAPEERAEEGALSPGEAPAQEEGSRAGGAPAQEELPTAMPCFAAAAPLPAAEAPPAGVEAEGEAEAAQAPEERAEEGALSPGEAPAQEAGSRAGGAPAQEELPTALPSFAAAGPRAAAAAAEELPTAMPSFAAAGPEPAVETAEAPEARAEAGASSSGEAPAREADVSPGGAPAQELPTAMPCFAAAGPEPAAETAEARAEAGASSSGEAPAREADVSPEGAPAQELPTAMPSFAAAGPEPAAETAEAPEARAEAGASSSGEAPAREADVSPGGAPAQELPTTLPSFAVAGPEPAFAAAEASAEMLPDAGDTMADGMGEAEATVALEERAEVGVLSSGEAPAQEAALSPGDAPAQEELPTALPSFAVAGPERATDAADAEAYAEAPPPSAGSAAEGPGAVEAAEPSDERAEKGAFSPGEAPAQEEAGLCLGGAPAQEAREADAAAAEEADGEGSSQLSAEARAAPPGVARARQPAEEVDRASSSEEATDPVPEEAEQTVASEEAPASAPREALDRPTEDAVQPSSSPEVGEEGAGAEGGPPRGSSQGGEGSLEEPLDQRAEEAEEAPLSEEAPGSQARAGDEDEPAGPELPTADTEGCASATGEARVQSREEEAAASATGEALDQNAEKVAKEVPQRTPGEELKLPELLAAVEELRAVAHQLGFNGAGTGRGSGRAGSKRLHEALQLIDACPAAEGCGDVREQWRASLLAAAEPFREARRLLQMAEALRRQGYLGDGGPPPAPQSPKGRGKGARGSPTSELLDLGVPMTALIQASRVLPGAPGWVPTYRL